jgi:hypothetical protein
MTIIDEQWVADEGLDQPFRLALSQLLALTEPCRYAIEKNGTTR